MNRVERLAFGISVFAILLYVLWIMYSYPMYQNQRISDPLALVWLSTPMLSIIILSMLVISALIVYVRSDSQFLHIWLVLQLCVVTWLTPWFLSGFSKSPDTLWHIGVSQRVGDISMGARFMFSDYFVSYPCSFIFHFITLNITNLDHITYSLYLFPVLTSAVMVLMWYSIICRLSDSKTAFISTVLMIMIFYIIEIHPCPRAVGTILVLTSLSVGLREGRHVKFAILLLISALTLTHPMLPILFLIFLFVFYLVRRFIASDWAHARGLKPNTFLVIFVAWLAWSFFEATQIAGLSISRALYNILTFNFTRTFWEATSPYNYIFPWITSLRLLYLLSFGIIATLFAVSVLPHICKPIFFKHNPSGIKCPVEATFIVASVLFFIMEMVSAIFHGIRDRSLFFFLLMVSFLAALGVKKTLEHKSQLAKYAKIATICWLAFMSFAYPLIAYNTEAFYSYPPSEDAGLKFVTSNIEMNGKSVSMYRINRLATYLEPNVIFTPVSFPPISGDPDVVIFLKSAYFEIAMIMEISFDNNSYIQSYNELSRFYGFNKIYSNPTCEIFSAIR